MKGLVCLSLNSMCHGNTNAAFRLLKARWLLCNLLATDKFTTMVRFRTTGSDLTWCPKTQVEMLAGNVLTIRDE